MSSFVWDLALDWRAVLPACCSYWTASHGTLRERSETALKRVLSFVSLDCSPALIRTGQGPGFEVGDLEI